MKIEAADEYLSGASIHALAERYEMSTDRMRKLLLQAGVTVRPRGGSTPPLPPGVVDSYLAGASVAELAEKHGLPIRIVRRGLKRAGVVLRSHRLPLPVPIDLAERYTSGASVRTLAHHYEVSQPTVRQWLATARILLRDDRMTGAQRAMQRQNEAEELLIADLLDRLSAEIDAEPLEYMTLVALVINVE